MNTILTTKLDLQLQVISDFISSILGLARAISQKIQYFIRWNANCFRNLGQLFNDLFSRFCFK